MRKIKLGSGWQKRFMFLSLVWIHTAWVAGGEEVQRLRYANRPDDLMPYAKVKIYKDLYAKRTEFNGGGRDLPEPESLRSVRIGLIGPLTEEDRPLVPTGFVPVVTSRAKALFGRHLLRGALLAMEGANASGGYRGMPFELVRRTDLVKWGQTSNELAKFAYQDKVWAIISSLDSNHSHVLNRATLKAEVPLVNAGSSDPTLTEHSIPWLIRCMSDDRLNSYELLNYIHRVRGLSRIAILRVNDRDGRVGVEEFIKGARRLGIPVQLELRFQNGDTDFRGQLEQIRRLNPEVVVLWANPPEGGAIVKQMRHLGFDQLVVGFDRLSHPLFLQDAGDAAEGMVVASAFNPNSEDPNWIHFREHYLARYGEEPDSYAVHGFDAMSLVVSAVRHAGLNRVRIRDYLYRLRTFAGASGEIRFDVNMNDVGRPWLAEVKNGEFHFFRPPDWKRSKTFFAILQSEEGGY